MNDNSPIRQILTEQEAWMIIDYLANEVLILKDQKSAIMAAGHAGDNYDEWFTAQIESLTEIRRKLLGLPK
jgi:hypothetical protein